MFTFDQAPYRQNSLQTLVCKTWTPRETRAYTFHAKHYINGPEMKKHVKCILFTIIAVHAQFK